MLLILVVFLSDFVRIIPMPALVAIMIMIMMSVGTFSWSSIRDLRTHLGPNFERVVRAAKLPVLSVTPDAREREIGKADLRGPC